jgi:glycosyltransferase 2 family protein
MSDAASATGTHGWARRHAGALAGSLAIFAGFAWLLHAGALPIVPPAGAFLRFRWWAVPGYALLWLTVLLLRSGRWHFLLAPIETVALKRILTVSLIGNAAVILLPFRLGELVRPTMIRKKGTLSGWAATGTVGAERIIDGLVLSGLLLVALPLASPHVPLPDKIGNLPISPSVVPKAAYSALAVFAMAFLAMGTFYWRRDWARRVTRRVVGVVSIRLADTLSSAVERVASGLGFLPRVRFTGPFVALTLLYWCVSVAGIQFLLWGAGIDGATFARAGVIMGVLGLGVVLPNAPGFFGAFQISLYAALALFFSPDIVVSSGAAFVFVAYVAQVGIGLLAGFVSLLIDHVSAREVIEAELEG